ncbi:hypothetical protein Ae201684P_018395 [Aphanomyces euteiches]|nr:hypothetical protein Ae201684P_018395 [Aphanomyces euteiches]
MGVVRQSGARANQLPTLDGVILPLEFVGTILASQSGDDIEHDDNAVKLPCEHLRQSHQETPLAKSLTTSAVMELAYEIWDIDAFVQSRQSDESHRNGT